MSEISKPGIFSKIGAFVGFLSALAALTAAIYAGHQWLHQTRGTPSPEEARETLQKRGYEMDAGGLGDTIRTHDGDGLKLFLIAGFKLTPSELQSALDDRSLTPIIEQYAIPGKQNAACPTDDTAIAFYKYSDSSFRTVKKICGNPTVISQLKSTQSRYEKAAEKASGASEVTRSCQTQVQQLGTRGLLEMSKTLDDQQLSAMSGWSNLQNAAYLLRMHYTSGTWGGDQAELAAAMQVCDGVQQSSQQAAQSEQQSVSQAAAFREIISRLH